MKEKIDNEFKPRTWLLGILIFIALVIVVILINKIVLVSKERKILKVYLTYLIISLAIWKILKQKSMKNIKNN